MRNAIVLASLLLATVSISHAAIVSSLTPAVGTPDRLMTFDGVVGDTLSSLPSTYVEDDLSVSFNPSPGGFYRHTFTQATPFWGGIFSINPQFSGRTAYFSSDSSSPYAPLRIATADGADVTAMQFNVDSGYGGTLYAYWEAYRDGVAAGSGQIQTVGSGLLFGFSGDAFDELLIGSYFQPFSSFSLQNQNGNALYVDNIAVAFAVPEPGALALVGISLAALAVTRRRKQYRQHRRFALLIPHF